jgi:hypothetical protein
MTQGNRLNDSFILAGKAQEPSPLVGEGWVGGIAPAVFSAPSWTSVEGGIPPSLTLPHKGGEDRLWLRSERAQSSSDCPTP